MIEIKFKDMKVLKDGRTIRIIGECKGKEIEIELSILQLAKVWNSDKKVLEKLKYEGFGSAELEYECKETVKMVSEFPNINVNLTNKIEILYDRVVIRGVMPDIIMVCGEDLNGWDNEGIRIKFPKELYPDELEEIKFDFILKPNSIELKLRF